MLKKLLGFALGFNKEIAHLRKELSLLSFDKAWGMHTRSALSRLNGFSNDHMVTTALLYFDGLGERKKEIGEVEVDNRIRTVFKQPLRQSDTVVRWDDDEVAMVFASDNGGAEIPLKRLAESAEEQGIAFSYTMKKCNPSKTLLPEVFRELSKIVKKKVEKQ